MDHRNTSATFRRTRATAVAAAAAVLLSWAGCIEIQRLLQGGDAGDGRQNNGGRNENRNLNDPDDGASAPPTVRLTASNPVPFLDEQVTLRCIVVGDGGGNVTFAFDPDDTLFVDENAGTAAFVVTRADLLNELRFTCTGTNEAGTGPPSDPVSVIPIASPEPPPPPEPDPSPDQPPP